MSWNPYRVSEVQSVLRERGLWLTRSRGQNYLVEASVAKRIVELVPQDAVVLEVGCGLGALTVLLPPRRVYALEIDRGVLSLVRDVMADVPVIWIEGDFLKFDVRTIDEEKLFFLSNLPYSISGEAIRRFLEIDTLEEGVVMVQKEFYDRMVAKPGSDSYGVFSLLSQSFLNVERVFSVPRGCFFPVPAVDSVVVRIRKKTEVMGYSRSWYGELQREFREFLLEAFGSKRKTLVNNLKKRWNESVVVRVMEEFGLSERIRPEEIELTCWQKLFLRLREGR